IECIPVMLKQDKVYRVKSLAPTVERKLTPRLQSWLTTQHDRLGKLRQRINLYQAARERTGPFRSSPLLRGMLSLACRTARLGCAAPQKVLSYISLNYVDTARAEELECQPDD